MLGLVVGVLAMTGWRRAGAWGWIAGGLVLFAISDSLYFYGIAVGTYQEGVIYDAGWPTAVLLLAYGAWTPASPLRAEAARARREILLPIVFAGASLGLLIFDHFHPTNVLALALASACLVAVLMRLVVTHGDNRRMLAASRAEASTDALTGLGNRRSLTRELELVVAEATADRPACLAIFDLDGFKAYNDIFGHPAGDSLLIRLSSTLRAVASRAAATPTGWAATSSASSPRPEDGDVDRAARGSRRGAQRARRRLRRSPAPTARSVLPTEAAGAEHALHVADQRMYAAEERRPRIGRAPVERRAAARAVGAPSLARRRTSTAWRSSPSRSASGSACCRRSSRTCARPRELHDIGKVAIPDAILDKPGPLDDAEWEFMRRHTIIGERILQAAPALQRVASDRALDPRAHGRQGLSRPAGRRGDPARRADRARLRRLRGDDRRPQLPQGDERRGRDRGARALRGHAVRPARRRGVPRARQTDARRALASR